MGCMYWAGRLQEKGIEEECILTNRRSLPSPFSVSFFLALSFSLSLSRAHSPTLSRSLTPSVCIALLFSGVSNSFSLSPMQFLLSSLSQSDPQIVSLSLSLSLSSISFALSQIQCILQPVGDMNSITMTTKATQFNTITITMSMYVTFLDIYS